MSNRIIPFACNAISTHLNHRRIGLCFTRCGVGSLVWMRNINCQAHWLTFDVLFCKLHYGFGRNRLPTLSKQVIFSEFIIDTYDNWFSKVTSISRTQFVTWIFKKTSKNVGKNTFFLLICWIKLISHYNDNCITCFKPIDEL